MNSYEAFEEYWQNELFHKTGMIPELQTMEIRKKYEAEERIARWAWYAATTLFRNKINSALQDFNAQ